jgi:hypothetical protein
LGLSSTSSSFLISALTTLLMLPSIGLAMRLMDVTGRRYVLYFFYDKKIPSVRIFWVFFSMFSYLMKSFFCKHLVRNIFFRINYQFSL